MEAIPGEKPQQKGLMSIYVDDVLYAAEPSVLQAAAKAVDGCWKCSPLEVATETEAVRFCGMEIFRGQEGGYHVVQEAYTKELLKKYEITWGQATDVPNYKVPKLEEIEEGTAGISEQEVQKAQAMTGALLRLEHENDLAHDCHSLHQVSEEVVQAVGS